MRLLIVSNMRHYRRADGQIVGWGPTVQEIDHLSTRFDSVRHIACLHEGSPTPSFIPYTRDVTLVPLAPTGGDTWRAKVDVLTAMPGYVATMLRELPHADVVHLRCPANLPMIAATLLPFVSRPNARWLKYAGNWRPTKRGSLPFAYQRWLLATKLHRGVVTVNGNWPGQPEHVKSFFNPSLTDPEIAAARALAAGKTFDTPLRLLFVGTLWQAKGCGTAIEALAELVRRGIDARLDILGDGPERAAYELRAADLGLGARVTFHGWLHRDHLGPHYAAAHFLVFPTTSEGWPKVLSEGMAYGCVPIASAVGAIPQYLTKFGSGEAISAPTPAQFADAIAGYDASRWQLESQRGFDAAPSFSYAHYLDEVDALLAAMASR